MSATPDVDSSSGVKQLSTSTRDRIPSGLRWLESLVASYRTALLKEPFYEIATSATSVSDFLWARQLLHHSTEFPRVLEARRDCNTDERYSRFFTEHVEEEVGHSDMLTAWLKANGLVPEGEEALARVPTYATVACLSHAYRAALTTPPQENIVALNVAVEAASFDFFSQLSPLLDRLGHGAVYWRLHMELDEFHSADGLALLDECEEDSAKGRTLALWARESAAFWGAMLNSWVGVDQWPSLQA
jgi:Iron-containing redox enzyme